ncbi:MAG: efflux RND transporter permease subunit [Candidatus Brocadiia bacterium]
MIISDISIRRPVMAAMIILAMIIFGIVSYPKIGVDLMPNTDFPIVSISTVLRGASPETIETRVSKVIEDAVSTVSGLKHLTSQSRESLSVIICEFELEVNGEFAAQDVRDKVGRITNKLPSDTESPIIMKFDTNSSAVVTVVLKGPDGPSVLTKFAEDSVKPTFQKIIGVGDISIAGGRERQVRVWLNNDKLTQYAVSPIEVVGALRSQNIEIPGGRLEMPKLEYIIKTKGEIPTVAAFEELVITYRNGTPIRLRDLGRVEDGTEEFRTLSRVNGENAIGLSVTKQSGANTVRVVDLIRAEMARFSDPKNGLMPRGYEMEIALDTSTFVRDSFNDVKKHLFLGGLLAVLIVLFFLKSFRSTFIAALSIPTSIFATFIFINAFGFTFNNLTMLALSVSIGMLVDDAIVVIENIYRHLENGEKPMAAARNGTNEIALAVMSTTFSIVAVFVPVAFMKGIVGRFFFEFGITVTVAVLASLLVSLVLTPMLSSRLLRKQEHNAVERFLENMFEAVERAYSRLIRLVLHGAASQATVLAIAFASLILAGYFASKVPTEFTPTMDRGEISVDIKAPLGSTMVVTDSYLRQIEAYALSMPETRLAYSTVSSSSEVYKGSVYVKLVDSTERERKEWDVIDDLRKFCTKFAEVETAVGSADSMRSGAGMGSADIQFDIRGENLEQISGYAQLLKSKLLKTTGFSDVRLTYDPEKPELRVVIDRDKAAAFGVTAEAIGMAINICIGGMEATEFREFGDQYEVWVRLEEPQRNEPSKIYDVPIRTSSGQIIRLYDLVRVEKSSGPVQIDRKERRRQVSVMANLQKKIVTLGTARTIIEKEVADLKLPASVSTSFSGMADMQQESFGYIFESLFIAVACVYLILASQFNSYVHPLTIMFSLPLSLAGAMGALYISGLTVNILSLIGVILLMGLVTKNAILLVDFTNRLRSQGLSRKDALAQAGSIRLRPIIMTTLATIFGMLPIVIGIGAGSEMRKPMAVAVVGGLITSTLLTLVVVPVIYNIFDAFGQNRLFKKVVSLVVTNEEAEETE